MNSGDRRKCSRRPVWQRGAGHIQTIGKPKLHFYGKDVLQSAPMSNSENTGLECLRLMHKARTRGFCSHVLQHRFPGVHGSAIKSKWAHCRLRRLIFNITVDAFSRVGLMTVSVGSERLAKLFLNSSKYRNGSVTKICSNWKRSSGEEDRCSQFKSKKRSTIPKPQLTTSQSFDTSIIETSIEWQVENVLAKVDKKDEGLDSPRRLVKRNWLAFRLRQYRGRCFHFKGWQWWIH